jgi:hypothetical protein
MAAEFLSFRSQVTPDFVSELGWIVVSSIVIAASTLDGMFRVKCIRAYFRFFELSTRSRPPLFGLNEKPF